jgi:hypothetical protein
MNNISLREWFAGQALAGLLASGHFTTPDIEEDMGPWMKSDDNGDYEVTSAAWILAGEMMSGHKKYDHE